MPIERDLELGGKAVEQLDKGLRKGPIIRIISVLSVAIIISFTFNIKLLLDSRDRELDLKDEVIEEVRKQVREQMSPIQNQVSQTMTKMDSTLVKTDSLLIKADNIIQK